MDAGPAPPGEIVLRVGEPTDGGRLLGTGNVFSGTVWYPFRGTLLAAERLTAPPHQLGALRYSLASVMEHRGLTRAQFETQVPAFVDQLSDLELLDRWSDGGGELIFNLYETPDWLGDPAVGPHSACGWRTDDFRFFRPPLEVQAWAASVVTPLVRTLVARFGRGLRYELWNEPTTCTWLGTTQRYMELYEATALAVRAVDPTARVGGPSHADSVGTGGTLNDPPNPPRFVQRLIEFARDRRLPLDFVSLHAYSTNPNPDFEYHERQIAIVRAWLGDAGYPDVELINDEWNYDAYYSAGAVADVVNFSGVDSVYTAQTLLAFDRAGYANQAGQALEDTGDTVASQTFTWAHALPRPGYQVFELFSELRGSQLEVSAPHPWVRATAFRDGKTVRLVAASFPSRSSWILEAAVLTLARTDSSALAAFAQAPDAGIAFLTGASAALPASLTPSQQHAFGAGREQYAADVARQRRWGISGDPVDAIRTPGNAVTWRLELPSPPARVTHRSIDINSAVDSVKLRQLAGPLSTAARTAACTSTTRLLAGGSVTCNGLNSFCSTGNATTLANPPAACRSAVAFVVYFMRSLDQRAIESTLEQLGEAAKLPAYRAEFAVALAEYRVAWKAMWNDPLLRPREEELPLRTSEDGGLVVSFDALPYSVHLLSITVP